MVYKILAYMLFGFLVIALVLSFAGVREVYLGDGFRNWLVSVNDSFQSWSFSVPKIPDIPYLETSQTVKRSILRVSRVVTVPVWNTGNSVLDQLKNFLNTFIFFFNFIITILNFFVTIINIFISILQFVLTLVWSIKDLPSFLTNSEWARYDGESTIWWWPSVGQ